MHDAAPPEKSIAPNKPDPLIGGRLGDYEIRRQIARGGMARVYEGYDPGLDRRAAIKVIDIAGADPTEAREITERFFREARKVANLDHPNIVTVYQFGEFAPQYFMAMKLLEGRTLQETLKRLRTQKRLMPPEQILSIMDDVSAALDYAHGQGVIHRDVKPSNIMLTPSGRAILMDFGLLMEFGKDNTLGTAFGTPRYIAPEQAVASHRAVPQSDIYALGVVVYEMVCGQTPFDGASAMELAIAHMSNPPPPLRSVNPDAPPSVEVVVLRALDKTPEVRWKSASAFAQALRSAYLNPGQPAHFAPEPREEIVPQADLTPILVNREPLLSAVAQPVIANPLPSTARSPEGMPVPQAAPHSAPAQPVPIAAKATAPAAQVAPKPAQTPDQSAPKTVRLPTPRRPKPLFWVLAGVVVALIGFAASFAVLPPVPQPASGAPTNLPARVQAAKAIRLIFSDGGLAILNVGTSAIPLKELTFSPDGRTFVPAITQGELAPGGCIYLKAENASPVPEPMCQAKTAVKAASLFWQRPDAFSASWEKRTFRCTTDINTCEIALN